MAVDGWVGLDLIENLPEIDVSLHRRMRLDVQAHAQGFKRGHHQPEFDPWLRFFQMDHPLPADPRLTRQGALRSALLAAQTADHRRQLPDTVNLHAGTLWAVDDNSRWSAAGGQWTIIR